MITGLAGRVAVVTGAASGIGAETSRQLLAEGASVLGVDLAFDELAAPNPQGAEEWVPFVADISGSRSASMVVNAAHDRFGRLDVLIHCAGIYETGSMEEVDEQVWDRVQSVNLRGAYLLSRAAIPMMAQGGHGRILFFSSIAAQTGGGNGAGPAYVSSKAGLLGLTRSLAQKAGPLGITVNCISPGVIVTPMIAGMDEAKRRSITEITPLRRLGTVSEVASVAVMLASNAAAFISGARVDVNGGLNMA